MKQKELTPGKDVLSYCGVCKLVMNHVIINMKNHDSIGHCECLTCHARHPYRDPVPPLKKSGAKPRVKTISIPVTQAWASEVNQARGPVKPYSTTAIFTENDLIVHPTFGKGVVKKILESKKIEVIFQTDFKILVHQQ